MTNSTSNALMFTVVPVARSSSNVSPAGTVKEFMFTVVHLTAAATSDMDEMVPVQAEVASATSPLGAARASGSRMERRTKERERAMASFDERLLGRRGRELPVDPVESVPGIYTPSCVRTAFRIRASLVDQRIAHSDEADTSLRVRQRGTQESWI